MYSVQQIRSYVFAGAAIALKVNHASVLQFQQDHILYHFQCLFSKHKEAVYIPHLQRSISITVAKPCLSGIHVWRTSNSPKSNRYFRWDSRRSWFGMTIWRNLFRWLLSNSSHLTFNTLIISALPALFRHLSILIYLPDAANSSCRVFPEPWLASRATAPAYASRSEELFRRIVLSFSQF